MAKSKKPKSYVVWVGRTPGVYATWDACKAEVDGVPGAKYKSFPTRAEAEAAYCSKPTRSVAPDAQPSRPRPAASSRTRSAAMPRRISKGVAPHAEVLQGGKTVVYTDGGADGNPGPGGYGVVILKGETRQELSGGYRNTTNNRMELMGWIVALETLPAGEEVVIFSDSKYVGDMWSKGYAEGWRSRGWRKADKQPAANADLWSRLLNAIDAHDVTYVWVKGHVGHDENERCDELAGAAAHDGVDQAYEDGATTLTDGGLFG